MSRIVDQLVYKISADTSGAEKGLDTTGKKFDAVGNIAKVAMGAVTVGAIVKVVKSLGDLAIQSTVALDRVDKMSQKIGVSRQGFQEWDYILSQSGASVDGLQMSMKTLSTQAEQVTQGSSESVRMFERLGVEVTDVNGKMKDQETLFNEVFLALSSLESETERTALASKLLGRSATELAPAMNSGADSIEGLRDQAHKLGLVYEDDLIDAGVRLTDNIDSLKRSFEAFKTRAMAPVVSTLITVTDKMLGQYSASGTLEGALDRVKTATERYKNAQDEAKGKTDDLTEAMLAQARIELVQSIKALSDEWGKSSKEYDRTQKRINNLTTDIDVAKDVLSDFKDEWERKTGELFDVEMLGGDDLVEYKGLIDTIFDSQDELLNQQLKLGEAEKLRENLVQKLAEAYLDFGEDLTYLVERETDLHDAVVKRIGSVEKERKALAWATEEMKKYANASGEELDSKIKQVENSIKVLKGRDAEADLIAFLNLLTKQRNELLAIEAQKTEDANVADEKRQKIIDNANTAVATAVDYAEALGDAFDLNAEKTSIYTGAIKALIDSGLDPAEERVKELIDKLPDLASTTDDTTTKIKTLAEVTSDYSESLKTIDARLEVTSDKQAHASAMVNLLESSLVDLMLAGEQNSDLFQKLSGDYTTYVNILAKLREKTDDTLTNEEKINLVLEENEKQLKLSANYAKALGDNYNEASNNTGILTNSIKQLLDLGLDPTDKRITDLLAKMPALSDELDDLAGDVSKALTPLEKWNESLHDSAYLFGITGDKQAYYRSMVDDTQKALLEMRKEGVEPASEEYQKMTRMLDGFNEKLKESQKDANAWKSTTVEAISAVSSTFTALGSLMGATTEARLQELDAMLQAELKAQGVAEETEMESLQKRLAKAIETGDAELQAELEREIKRQGIREDFDEKKKQIQIEEAQRQKALAIFQAIIDTASAIIKAMPNPYLMSLAGATGAIQLATIQAQPLPSFDVGSLRIERDTQAIVHRNEMILPASLSEQARKEGITISPKGGQDIHLQVYMDSKPIIDTTVRGINSGVYRIDARVVK
jgi:hypothetical protein